MAVRRWCQCLSFAITVLAIRAPAVGQSTLSSPSHQGRYRVDGVTSSIACYDPDPHYTKQAREAKIKGTVQISAIMGKDGCAHNPKVVKPLGYGLDESAIYAVERWRFRKPEKELPINIEVNFDPRSSSDKPFDGPTCTELRSKFSQSAPTQRDVPVSTSSPLISLLLPPRVTSEGIEIEYFLSGPFSGFGISTSPPPYQCSYDINASVEGKAAKSAKIVAYIPGCQFTALDLAVLDATTQRQLECKPLPTLPFAGQIVPLAAFEGKATEVEVIYLAPWASHGFFGLADGMVTSIRLAHTIPEENGTFHLSLPDFTKDDTVSRYATNLGSGEYQFILRESGTGNIVASLRPLEVPQRTAGVKVQSSYPEIVQFIAESR